MVSTHFGSYLKYVTKLSDIFRIEINSAAHSLLAPTPPVLTSTGVASSVPSPYFSPRQYHHLPSWEVCLFTYFVPFFPNTPTPPLEMSAPRDRDFVCLAHCSSLNTWSSACGWSASTQYLFNKLMKNCETKGLNQIGVSKIYCKSNFMHICICALFLGGENLQVLHIPKFLWPHKGEYTTGPNTFVSWLSCWILSLCLASSSFSVIPL